GTSRQLFFTILHALRDRRQCLALASARGLPLRHDPAPALHALQSRQNVDPPRERPPTIAGGFHESHALDPSLADHGRDVTTHTARRDLDAQQTHPVLEPRQIDELTAPGDFLTPAIERLPGAPQAPRIETRDDDMSLRP